MTPAQQMWVCTLPIMQQSVLFSALRGPDGLRKDHPVKVFMRWYRRCVLLSAFDQRALTDPLAPGGGSFTGPLPLGHTPVYPRDHWLDTDEAYANHYHTACRSALALATDEVFRAIDEMPHHFWLHLVHGAQILGIHHPEPWIRSTWQQFYIRACDDMHMVGEADWAMNDRLSDSEPKWRAREATPAKTDTLIYVSGPRPEEDDERPSLSQA